MLTTMQEAQVVIAQVVGIYAVFQFAIGFFAYPVLKATLSWSGSNKVNFVIYMLLVYFPIIFVSFFIVYQMVLMYIYEPSVEHVASGGFLLETIMNLNSVLFMVWIFAAPLAWVRHQIEIGMKSQSAERFIGKKISAASMFLLSIFLGLCLISFEIYMHEQYASSFSISSLGGWVSIIIMTMFLQLGYLAAKKVFVK